MAAKTKTVKSPKMSVVLIGDADGLLVTIKETDGAEIHRDHWPIAETLVARGLITLGAARGPGCNWRRAELVKPTKTRSQFGQPLDGDGNCICPEAPKPHAQHVPADHYDLRNAALKLVEQNALYWVIDGTSADERHSARAAFDLLVKHGYLIDARMPQSISPHRLVRPDGSEVRR